MLSLQVRRDILSFGDNLRVRFVRTLRVHGLNRARAALPDFGGFPIFCATDFWGSTPPAWQARPTVFIPVRPHEAMWIQFLADGPTPAAVKIGVAGVNALTGGPWHEQLCGDPQDYLVCPEQTRLDGYVVEGGSVRQFASLPLDPHDPIDPRGADQSRCSHLRLIVFEPTHSSMRRPHGGQRLAMNDLCPVPSSMASEQAVACDERHAIDVCPNAHEFHTWDSLSYGDVCVYLVSDRAFRHMTGQEPEASPVPAESHRHGGSGQVDSDDGPAGMPTDDNPPRAKYRPWVRRRNRTLRR
jgi:hypothetical protein